MLCYIVLPSYDRMNFNFVILPDQLFTTVGELEVLKGADTVFVSACPLFLTPAMGRTRCLMYITGMRWYTRWLTTKGVNAIYLDRKKIEPRGNIFDYLIGSKSQIWTYDRRDTIYDVLHHTYAGTYIKFHSPPTWLFENISKTSDLEKIVEVAPVYDHRMIIKGELPPTIIDKVAYESVTKWTKGNYVWVFGEPDAALQWFDTRVKPYYSKGDLWLLGVYLSLGVIVSRQLLIGPLPLAMLQDLIDRENAAVVPYTNHMSLSDKSITLLSSGPYGDTLQRIITGRYISISETMEICCYLIVTGCSLDEIHGLFYNIPWYNNYNAKLVLAGEIKNRKFPWDAPTGTDYTVLLQIYKNRK